MLNTSNQGGSIRPISALKLQTPEPFYLRGILFQVFALAVAGTLLWVWGDRDEAISVVCGVACALLPNAYFAFRLHRATQLYVETEDVEAAVASVAEWRDDPGATNRVVSKVSARADIQNSARLLVLAQVGKLLLSATCFALVFAVVQPPNPGLVFVGFGGGWLLHTLLAIRLMRAA
ncbi:MAG: ATP synthase subunit I [Pseudomonadota bacterium]